MICRRRPRAARGLLPAALSLPPGIADTLARRAGSVVAASAACGTHLARAAPAAETKWKTESGRRSAIDRQKRAWCGRQHGDVRLVLAQRALRDWLRATRDGAEAGGHVGRRRAVRVHGARLVVARHHDRQLAGVGARSRRRVRADAVDAAARRPLAVKRHRAGEGRRFRRRLDSSVAAGVTPALRRGVDRAADMVAASRGAEQRPEAKTDARTMASPHLARDPTISWRPPSKALRWGRTVHAQPQGDDLRAGRLGLDGGGRCGGLRHPSRSSRRCEPSCSVTRQPMRSNAARTCRAFAAQSR